jgi:hypothetical protein
MKIHLFFLGLVLGISCHVFSQALSDSVFNSTIRKFNGGWIAGDATFSIALPEQKTLWLFGDSFIGTVKPDNSIATGAKMIRNCAVLQDGDSMTALFGGTLQNPKSFVSSSDDNADWYWPEHGLLENDTLKIFFSEFVLASGPAGFNFKYKALNLASFTYPDIKLVDFKKLPYYDFNGVCYGNSVLVENGYTYIYGRKESDTVNHIPYPHIARVAEGNIMAPWEFYNGSSWSTDPNETQKISVVAVSQQYGVFKLNNKYIVINQEIWFSTKIYSYTSNFPQGPWSNKVLVYNTPILFKNTFTYNAFPHPQFNEDGKLLISYNSNGNFADIFKNVEVYRPRFIRIPYIQIDPTFVSITEYPKKKSNLNAVILYQNYPNPAELTTKIKFTVIKKGFVSLHLDNIEGKEIQSYVNKILDPGAYDVDIDLHKLKSGIYNYRINNTCLRLIKN